MRESLMYGSVRGARGNSLPTATFCLLRCMSPQVADFCCKSLFALVIKISFGCTRDFRVNMWGTSLPEDKLAGDLGNVIGATSIGGRRRIFFTARKLAQGNLGLLQQYRHTVSIRCGEGSDAIGAKRTCRERRERVA